MISKFQHFRQRCYFGGMSRPITDGNIVFEAAEWKEFREYKTNTPLTTQDLEALGYHREMTAEAIRNQTKKLLNEDDLPLSPTWCDNYITAIAKQAKGRPVYLIPEEPMRAVRSALEQILVFCEGAPEEVKHETKQPHLIEKISDVCWRFVLKRFYKF